MRVKIYVFLFILTIVSAADVYADQMSQAAALEQKGDYKGALAEYSKLFEEAMDQDALETLNAKIESLNIKLLFSNIVDEYSRIYEVKPGDALVKIAKKYNTTVDLIKISNKMSSDIIHVGDRLKVSTAEFSVFVDKSQNILFLKRGNDILKTYKVATGANNGTPVGEFFIKTKLKDPVHFRRDIGAAVPPGSDNNVLGTRWMGFDIPGYGIHGHAVPGDLGRQVTLGCVRMLNSDVEELYTILPQGTKVIITD